MVVAYIIYLAALAVFFALAGMGMYHIHRFATEWGRIRFITIVFVIGSIVIISLSFIYMLNTPWGDIF